MRARRQKAELFGPVLRGAFVLWRKTKQATEQLIVVFVGAL